MSLSKKKTVCFYFLMVLIPIVLLFSILEIISRISEQYRTAIPVDIGLGFTKDSLLFNFAGNARLETNPNKLISFHKQSFLVPKPPKTARIFALGGSSVRDLQYELLHLSDELQRHWSQKFNDVEIINCGGDSYGSTRLLFIMNEIMYYEPDMILLYTGHNEFEELRQLRTAHIEHILIQHILSKSAFYRLIRDIYAKHQIKNLNIIKHKYSSSTSMNWTSPNISNAWQYEFSQDEIKMRMKAFHDNLDKIINISRYNHVPIIIGTVPSNLVSPNLSNDAWEKYAAVLELFRQGKYEEGASMGRKILCLSSRHQSSDLENAIIRQLADNYNIPLADVEKAIIDAEPNHVPGETLFIDHCHLTAEGYSILRKTFCNTILESDNVLHSSRRTVFK